MQLHVYVHVYNTRFLQACGLLIMYKGFVILVKFFMCALVSRVHMMFYVLIKKYTVPGNQGPHDKLNQIQISQVGSRFST